MYNQQKRKSPDLLFSWNVAKYVKSDAIVYAKGQRTIGVGAGQMSRVNSARIAAIKAEHAGLELLKVLLWHQMPSSLSVMASITLPKSVLLLLSSQVGLCVMMKRLLRQMSMASRWYSLVCVISAIKLFRITLNISIDSNIEFRIAINAKSL